MVVSNLLSIQVHKSFAKINNIIRKYDWIDTIIAITFFNTFTKNTIHIMK